MYKRREWSKMKADWTELKKSTQQQRTPMSHEDMIMINHLLKGGEVQPCGHEWNIM